MERGTASLRRWWSNKYRLPPNHALFTGQTHAELNQEMIEDLMLRQKDIREELDDEDAERHRSRQEMLMSQLRSISRALGEDNDEVTQDELVAYWDAQVDRGEEPDLDMTLDDLRRLRAEGKA